MSVNGNDATDDWYSEVSLYDFNNPGYTSGVGHFTQLVWKGSKQLGCGVSCQNNYCSVTCNYFPAGNYLNQFSSNVFPLKEDSSDSSDSSDESDASDASDASDSSDSSDSSNIELENIRKNILTRHNYHRKRHQVDSLVRNSEIDNPQSPK